METKYNKYDKSHKLLFLDLETNSLDVHEADIKFVGCMDEKGEVWMKEWSDTVKEELKDRIDSCNKVITFNGEAYDLPILKRFGIDIPHWQHIDLYDIYKKKAPLIRSGGFKSYSLKNLVKEIGIKTDGKGTIDYKIFMKDKWSKQEYDEIYSYLKQDLVVTKQLWDYLLHKFEGLKEFLSVKDQKNFKHITSSAGSYAYKVICHELGIKDDYIESKEHTPYEGAYVMQPKKDYVKGNILYLDFASLYPMMYVHSNLFASKCDCCKDEEKWQGNDMFKISGKYCSKKQGRIEEIIKRMYLKRKEYKKAKDPREFAYKITLNSLYGISAKPSFLHLYSKHTASDCTGLARQCIDYAKNTLNSAGFEVVYADTDSCIVDLNGKSKEECLALADKISKDISINLPFPWDEFNFKLEDELDYIQFFRDEKGELKKKNYIYITKKGKMTIKGLDMVKKNCSDLGLSIFENHLKHQILEKKDCMFPKEYIDGLIKEAIEKNKLIISKTFNVRETDDYKSKTSIYNLIKDMYGTGEIRLIKNHKIGAGKGVKYCSVQEAEQLSLEDLDLEDVYKELSPFIIDYHNIRAKEKIEKRQKRKLLRDQLKLELKKDRSQSTLF